MPYNIPFPFQMNFSSFPCPAYKTFSLRESSPLRPNPNLCTSVFPILSLLYLWLPLSLSWLCITQLYWITWKPANTSCIGKKKWLNKAIIQSKGRYKAKNTRMLINIFLSYKSYRNITIVSCIALYVFKVSKNVFTLKVKTLIVFIKSIYRSEQASYF